MRFVVLLVALLGGVASAQGVTIKTTTTAPGGTYAPRNVTAIWIETCPNPPTCTTQGTFVKTCGRWANQRKQYLIDWNQQAGANDVDGMTSASRGDHVTPIQCTWPLTDQADAIVPNGMYRVRMETADADVGSDANNHEGMFTFTVGPNPQVQTNLSNGGFLNTSISYAAASGCGNGVVDPGETCDPIASCPTTCEPAADACMPNVLVGSSATCTAQCQMQLVTGCKNDDMCCPQGCTTATDNDCGKPGTSTGGGDNNQNDNDLQGGCSTTGNGGLLGLLMFGSALFVVRRKRL